MASPLNANPANYAEQASIASVGGVPYVAWEEATSNAPDAHWQVWVKRLDAGGWTAVGGPLNISSTQNAAAPSIADVGGVPYVAWSEWDGTAAQIRVKRWTGSSWVQVGTSANLSPSFSGSRPSLTSVGGVPYVAFEELEGNVRNIRVAQFNGSYWQSVGGPANGSGGNANSPKIASIGGVPYVAWNGGVSSGQVQVARYTGGAWSQLGGPSGQTQGGTAPMGLTGVGGVPYVALAAWTGSGYSGYYQVRVAQYTGGWSAVGDVLNFDPTKGANLPDITTVDGVPYVAWAESNGTAEQIRVARLTGGAWSPVGGSLNIDPTKDSASGGSPYGPSITSVGGVPYVAWQESNGTVAQIRVARLRWTLTVAKTGVGHGSVTGAPAGIDCGLTCTTTYDHGKQVTLTATSSPGSIFTGWSGGGCSGTGTCTVAMTSDQAVTATFGLLLPSHRTLSVTKTGFGTVTSAPAGISCGTSCVHAYKSGTQVTLTATPLAYSKFAGWGGACSGTGTCTVTMSTDRAVTASFKPAFLADLGVYPHKFSLAGKLVSGHCVPATGANSGSPSCVRPIVLRITYKLTLRGRVTFTLARVLPGRRVRGRCVAPSRRNGRNRRCTRLIALRGRITRTAGAGTHAFTFNGRIGGHTLTPGTYRLTAVPTAKGRRGSVRSITFVIVR